MASVFPPTVVHALNSILLLSSFHAGHLPIGAARAKAVRTRNGLCPARHFRDGSNHRYAFIYASSPSRGLEQVLRAWPAIRAGIMAVDGRATPALRVFYGFTPGFEAWARGGGLREYDAWRGMMEGLLKQPGVEYVEETGRGEDVGACSCRWCWLWCWWCWLGFGVFFLFLFWCVGFWFCGFQVLVCWLSTVWRWWRLAFGFWCWWMCLDGVVVVCVEVAFVCHSAGYGASLLCCAVCLVCSPLQVRGVGIPSGTGGGVRTRWLCVVPHLLP